MDKELKKKGEIEMNACALKPMMPFVTKGNWKGPQRQRTIGKWLNLWILTIFPLILI